MSETHSKHAAADHPILEPMVKRWSPYALEPGVVSDMDLRRCLEAARWAASSFNEQPWRFIVAKRENRGEFERALSCLAEANQAWAKNAGVLILTVIRRNFTRGEKPNRVAEHDLGLAAAQLTLQAVSLGLDVHQMAGVDLEKVRTTYGVPAGFDPMTAIAIGRAADPDEFENKELADRDRGGRTRKAMGEIAFGGRWGEAAGCLRV